MKQQMQFLIIFLSFLITGCQKWDLTATHFAGKITEIQDEGKNTIGEFTYRNGQLTKSWMSEKFYTPDENGVQSVVYTSVYTYQYTYNNDGFPISQTETYPNEVVNVKYFKY